MEKRRLTKRTPRAPIISCSAGRATEDGGMWYPDTEESRHKKREIEGNRREKAIENREKQCQGIRKGK